MGWRAALAFAFLLTGCYNPVNHTTANRYEQMCREAEADGRLGAAEEACRRAVINVRVGHVGPAAESQALYNLGRIQRRLGKLDEAEQALKESLKIEDTVSPPDPARTGRRLAEIAAIHGQTARFKEAWPYLERLIPIAPVYAGQERTFVKRILDHYAQKYRELGMQREAAMLAERANTL
jgi:tetratricopeptide (TPR) repeat protein